jgi:hypothetical protein
MCDFSQGLKCPRCGYLAKQERTFRVCRTLDEMASYLATVTAKPWVPVPNPMIGDRLANALAFFGVTKERVSQAVGGDCGCQQRQTGLNKVGGIVAKTVERGLHAAVTAVIGPREIDDAASVIAMHLAADPSTNAGLKEGPPSA